VFESRRANHFKETMINKRFRAAGRLPKGVMNSLEIAYSKHLDMLKASGEIVWFKFEGIKFRLANNTFYTPDFNVMRSDGSLEIHETKGFWRDDARVKIKVAASMYPMRFIGITGKSKAKGGGWEVEEF
jgi:hypothetical protein